MMRNGMEIFKQKQEVDVDQDQSAFTPNKWFLTSNQNEDLEAKLIVSRARFDRDSSLAWQRRRSSCSLSWRVCKHANRGAAADQAAPGPRAGAHDRTKWRTSNKKLQASLRNWRRIPFWFHGEAEASGV